MSLVDYASSDEDDADVREEQRHPPPPSPSPSPQAPKDDSFLSLRIQKSVSSVKEQTDRPFQTSAPIEKLPDASLLLNSSEIPHHLASCSDHSSRVAAAMAENETRKRDSTGLASGGTRSKVPKGTLPHSRKIFDTGGGALVPPQLRGRSNVVTEDIGKLFVKGRANPSSA